MTQEDTRNQPLRRPGQPCPFSPGLPERPGLPPASRTLQPVLLPQVLTPGTAAAGCHIAEVSTGRPPQCHRQPPSNCGQGRAQQLPGAAGHSVCPVSKQGGDEGKAAHLLHDTGDRGSLLLRPRPMHTLRAALAPGVAEPHAGHPQDTQPRPASDTRPFLQGTSHGLL